MLQRGRPFWACSPSHGRRARYLDGPGKRMTLRVVYVGSSSIEVVVGCSRAVGILVFVVDPCRARSPGSSPLEPRRTLLGVVAGKPIDAVDAVDEIAGGSRSVSTSCGDGSPNRRCRPIR